MYSKKIHQSQFPYPNAWYVQYFTVISWVYAYLLMQSFAGYTLPCVQNYL